MEDSQSVVEILEKATEEFCNKLCKWPAQYKDIDKLYDEHCIKCPINKLV